jgi:uncharacterized protein YaaR (DUF327 family)
MNNEQMKYIKQRASEIKSQKLNEIKEKFTDKGVSLTLEQKLQALKDGKFTVTTPPTENIKYGILWYSFISFNGEKSGKTDTEGLNKAKAEINQKFTKLMDELMLGDSEEALRLLKAFEAL